jgi:basic amino acid/polyamine antiporter, APA family
VSDDGLVRSLGLPAMTANAVNCIVASGVFVLPAVVAATIGSAWLIAYLICALAIALVFLSLAEAGSRVSETGGTYRYVDIAFGPYAGMLLGAVLLFSGVASSAAVADVFVGTLGEVMPALHDEPARAGVLVAMYIVLILINIRGVRAGAAVVEVVTLAKLAPLVILVVGGLIALRSQHVVVWGHASIRDIGRAALVLFFAFTGIEVALTPSGEVRSPARTMPRAVLLALLVVTALYIGAHYVAEGALGAGLATDQTAPLAATAAHLFGPKGRVLMLAAALLSTFAYVSGDILASPRILFAFGCDGYLPRGIGTVHARYRTPAVAIVAYGIIACTLAVTGTFKWLVVLASIAALLIYLASCLALLVLRHRNVRTDGQPFIVPGGPIIPLLACVVVVWLLAQASRAEWAAILAVLVAASVVYAFRRAAPSSPATPRSEPAQGV